MSYWPGTTQIFQNLTYTSSTQTLGLIPYGNTVQLDIQAGSTGPTGPTGSTGPLGPTGATQGPTGPTGPAASAFQTITTLQTGSQPSATAVGASNSDFVVFPTLGGSSNIPVNVGSLYNINGAFSVATTGGGYAFTINVKDGLSNYVMYSSASDFFAPSASLENAEIPFTTYVIPQNSNIQMFLTNSTAAGSNTTSLYFSPMWLVKTS